MSDFKTDGVPSPDYDSEDINYVYKKTEFTDDVFIYGKLYAELSGDIIPDADNKFSLGSSTNRWANIFSADLQLSNVHANPNSVDGTKGDWTLQEGEHDIFMINNITGKKYKINLTEV